MDSDRNRFVWQQMRPARTTRGLHAYHLLLGLDPGQLYLSYAPAVKLRHVKRNIFRHIPMIVPFPTRLLSVSMYKSRTIISLTHEHVRRLFIL